MLYPQNGGRSYRDHRLSGVISVTLCITSSVVDVGVGVAGPGRPALEYLSLADCGLVQIDVDAFSGLRNLTSLTLSRCLVNESLLARAFDKAAFRSRLMRLDISETYITNLSIELVGAFNNLVGLFASYCDLASGRSTPAKNSLILFTYLSPILPERTNAVSS